MSDVAAVERRRLAAELFLLTFVTLFLELIIIRWVPATVRLVAYFANLMLISSFLGIGLGSLLETRGRDLFRRFPLLLAAFTVFLVACRGIYLPASDQEHRYFAAPSNLTNFVVLIGIFSFNTAVFVPLGERIGALFDRLPALYAYSFDLGGSFVGTLCFGAFSYFFFSPLAGFAIVFALYGIAAIAARKLSAVAVVAALVCLGAVFLSFPRSAIWSPYYFIMIEKFVPEGLAPAGDAPADIRTRKDPPSYNVRVNQDFYQVHGTIDLARYTPGSFEYRWAEHNYLQYTVPYQVFPKPRRVMVVGAGSGKDVEAALLHGAEHVDAVEIDPVLIGISRKYNASGIYFDSRVHLVNDDARAAFARARSKYDLVVFSYLDSQALFSTMSSIRLDGFVYTVESLRSAYELVEDDGMLVVSFYGADWLRVKLVDMMFEATGRAPIAYFRGGQICLMSPKGAHAPPPESYGGFQLVPLPPGLAGLERVPPAEDDWPFLYLRSHRIPADYLYVIGALVLVAFAAPWTLTRMAWGARQTHFFFLGMGFLLLETRSVTDCSLYFGATWVITTVVIAGILLMVLAANVIAPRVNRRSELLYLPLIASLVLFSIVPSSFVLGFPVGARLLWVMLLVPLPVFFAGIVFSDSFRRAPDRSACFGANLVGATMGGLAEYASMIVGYRALSALTIVIYLLSLVVLLRTRPS